jgi:hypothetical protein
VENGFYSLKVQVIVDEKLKATRFNTLSVKESNKLGKDFALTNFSAITLEFVKCVTPVRKLYEKIVLILSWTAPFTTILHLFALSFCIYFSEWILLLLGLAVWSPLKNAIMGSLLTVELPTNSENMVEDFKKNLAFIQMIEISWVDACASTKSLFVGVNRNRLQSIVNVSKGLPVVALIVWYYFPKSAKIGMVLIAWTCILLCHPLGLQYVSSWWEALNQAKDTTVSTLTHPDSISAKVVNQVADTVANLTSTSKPPSSPIKSVTVKDVVVYENQRWWLGVGFVPKFFADGSR